MGTTERRIEIMRILCRKRYETIANLAEEFGVSKRTISRDIEILSITEPIYTQCGKYGGGVYVLDNYYINGVYMSEKEIDVLRKLASCALAKKKCNLNRTEIGLLETIITQYTKPKL